MEKNLSKELDEPLGVTKVEGNRRKVIRREFAEMQASDQSRFLDEICWGIIKTINPRCYVE